MRGFEGGGEKRGISDSTHLHSATHLIHLPTPHKVCPLFSGEKILSCCLISWFLLHYVLCIVTLNFPDKQCAQRTSTHLHVSAPSFCVCGRCVNVVVAFSSLPEFLGKVCRYPACAFFFFFQWRSARAH